MTRKADETRELVERRAFFRAAIAAAYLAPLISTYERAAYAQGEISPPPPRPPPPNGPDRYGSDEP